MSTITRERAQEIFLGNGPEPTASEERELARIALASLEADPVAWRSLYYENHGLLTGSKNVLASWQKQGWECEPLYTAPPAPVVPDAIDMDDDFDSAFEHGKAVGWNACRAAMLQGAAGNSPAHYDLRPEQKNSSPAQNPIDHGYRLDCDCSGCRSLAAICSALNGNSPAIPDGYALVPVDMAPEMMRAVQLNSELGAYAAANLSGAYSLFREFWDVAVAAVPHQEVKDPAGETISEPYEFNSMSQKFHYDRTFSFASAQQWVSCNERMPDAARNIAMYGWRIGSDGEPYYGPAVDEGYLALNGKFYAYDWDQPGSIGDIHAGIEFSATHWMYWELPEAPQQEGE